jgi:hypothetical protein
MLNFFKSFPLVQYQFEEDSADKTIIVDITRNVRAYLSEMDNANAYLFYEVNDGSRPDQISMELYKTPAYWWTFFVVNENLSEGLHAWPKSDLELEKYIKEKYERTAITPESKSGVTNDQNLLYRYDLAIGEEVRGLTSNATGTLDTINYDTNTILVKDVTGTFTDENIIFVDSEIALPSSAEFKNIAVIESQAVHHYIDGDGNTVHRLNFNADDAQLPVTNYEYEQDVNDSKLNIRVINPTVIDDFATRYRKLINS